MSNFFHVSATFSLVQAAEQEAASSIMAFFVGLGCAAGSLLSYGLLKLI